VPEHCPPRRDRRLYPGLDAPPRRGFLRSSQALCYTDTGYRAASKYVRERSTSLSGLLQLLRTSFITMGQSWSGQRTIQAAYERRGKVVALKSRQSKLNKSYDRGYRSSSDADSTVQHRYGQAASNSVTAKPGRGDRRSASSNASHPTRVIPIGKAKKERTSTSDKHRTKKEVPHKPKSSNTHSKRAESGSTRHKSLSRVDSHHHHNDEHKPNKEKKDCTVCTNTLSLHHFPDRPPTKNCKHEVDVCRKCLRTWIASESSSKLWNEITCPLCKTQLRSADMREFAPKDIFKRYDSLPLLPFHTPYIPTQPNTSLTTQPATPPYPPAPSKKPVWASTGAPSKAAKQAKSTYPTPPNSGATPAKRRLVPFTT